MPIKSCLLADLEDSLVKQADLGCIHQGILAHVSCEWFRHMNPGCPVAGVGETLVLRQLVHAHRMDPIEQMFKT